MKRLTLTLALILTTMMSFSQTKDSQGHILVSLWKTYYKAENADKPQDQAAALEAIKKEAAEKHLAWDFYDAATRYVDVRSSINWKDHYTLQSALDKEIDEMGEPVAVYFYHRSQWAETTSANYIREHKDILLASSNPEFYTRDGYVTHPIYSSALLEFIKNDYEYVIWSLFGSKHNSLVREYYKDKYPEAAFIAYSDCLKLNTTDAIYRELGNFVNKYSDKAASMLGRQWRLSRDFSVLRNAKGSTSDDFRALRSRCTTFEKDRARFTGDEKLIADCCTDVKERMIEELDGKDIGISASGNDVKLSLKNVKTLEFKVKSGTSDVWATTVNNSRNSYYLTDVVHVKLPDFDDGKYKIECKASGCKEETGYAKYALSVATRAIDEGYGIYVADYESGRPIESCSVSLLDADEKGITTVNDVALNGFTTLPDKIQSYLSKSSYKDYRIRVSMTDKKGILHMSEPIRVHSPHPGKTEPIEDTPVRRALILTDRGAYNPGETVKFKAVLYSGTYSYEVLPAGREVQVVLYDPQSNKLGDVELMTNEFGSIEGSFPLTGESRGGMFRLSVKVGGRTVETKSVRVDEFVLPTFELTWDADDMLYLVGDNVRVSGKVVSYSGHKLGNVRARYEIDGGQSGPLELRPDGSFSFEIPTNSNMSRYGFPVRVTIADETGETLEFNTYKRVNYRIPLSASLLNNVDGRYTRIDSESYYGGNWIIRDNFARIKFSTGGLTRKGLELFYEIKNESGKVVAKGSVDPNETKDVDLKGTPSGLYTLHVKASARRVDGVLETNDCSYSFVKAEDTDTMLDMSVSSFFKELGGEDIALQFGATDGPVWAVVELVGSGNVLLEHQIVTLDGVRGKAGSLKTISYSRKENYPESLTLTVLYFHKGRCYNYSRSIELPVIVKELPLSFTRFVDMARPGDECSLLIATEPGIECAAAVFDKATEEIQPNAWRKVTPYRRPEPRVSYSSRCGFCGIRYDYDEDMMAEGGRVLYKTRAVNASADMVEDAMVMQEAAGAVAEEAAEVELAAHVRDNFDATMAWEPSMRSDDKGQIELKFKGSDRLSTYYVQLFAHGKQMQNATLRQEMKISLPVKVAVVQPLFLYGGDNYVARATLSSSTEYPVSGRVSIRFFNGDDYKKSPVIGTKSASVTIPAGGSVPFSASFDVPSDVPVLGMLVNFVADDKEFGSDAVFVTVPVKTALQTITEAHSAVLLAGMDREALIADLRSQFVNADASSLVPIERDILAMIREAIPDTIEPKSDNVISLTEAYYSNVIARRVGAKGLSDEELAGIMKKIAACQNSGGGFTWFEGMSASPSVTAAILQRIYSMPEADLAGIDVNAAVRYLDDSYFNHSGYPWWRGTISLSEYLHTRSLYPDVPFNKPSAKAYKEFKKSVKEYLVPTGKRGLNGQILAKARRLRILQSLLTLPGGKDLAKQWGITLSKKIARSYDADVESLLQYAVKHRCGGCYYPNAVMPWRGLMESELYAHALLCNLFTSAADWGVNASGKPAAYAQASRDTAEGIRLWIMIQKETQQWEKDAAYIEAIACVLRGTPETLATKVIALSTTVTKPFPDIKASGNGFTIEREFSVNGKVLTEGDTVRFGDRVTARYRIWSEENRSFVRVTAPRPASMRPVDQLSGHYGWWMHPMSYGGFSFSPQGYRNVLSDKTEYWFDCYPEEKTTITEELFVTQEGVFQMPAVEVESLYAPHYRANDKGRGPLVSQ